MHSGKLMSLFVSTFLHVPEMGPSDPAINMTEVDMSAGETDSAFTDR